MKSILIINKIALFTTLTLFIIIYFGLLAQIPLGIIQIMSAIYLTLKTYRKSVYAKKHLSNYWIITITELILVYWLFYKSQKTYDAVQWLIMLIFPMSIAIYFYITMKKIVQEYETTKNCINQL